MYYMASSSTACDEEGAIDPVNLDVARQLDRAMGLQRSASCNVCCNVYTCAMLRSAMLRYVWLHYAMATYAKYSVWLHYAKCSQHLHAVLCYATQWLRRGYAVATPWLRRGYAVATPWLRRGYAVATPWLRRGYAVARRAAPPCGTLRHAAPNYIWYTNMQLHL